MLGLRLVFELYCYQISHRMFYYFFPFGSESFPVVLFLVQLEKLKTKEKGKEDHIAPIVNRT
jgi:hypothetical protein